MYTQQSLNSSCHKTTQKAEWICRGKDKLTNTPVDRLDIWVINVKRSKCANDRAPSPCCSIINSVLKNAKCDNSMDTVQQVDNSEWANQCHVETLKQQQQQQQQRGWWWWWEWTDRKAANENMRATMCRWNNWKHIEAKLTIEDHATVN